MDRSEVFEGVHLREYIRVVRKHVWLILACFLVITGAVAVGTYMQQPVYRAGAVALIAPEAPRVVNIQEVTPTGGDSVENFQTQVQIIRSRPVVQRVIDSLGLMERRAEHATCVGDRSRCEDLDAGNMGVPNLPAMGVLRRQPATAACRHADHERHAHLPARHVPQCRGIVHDLIEC